VAVTHERRHACVFVGFGNNADESELHPDVFFVPARSISVS